MKRNPETGEMEEFHSDALKDDLPEEEQAERLRVQQAGMRAAMLPLVKEIFAMFDADGDGKLSEEEYKAYLRGIGDAHDDDQWPEAGAEECKACECTMSEGITREVFESVLYGLAGRLGGRQRGGIVGAGCALGAAVEAAAPLCLIFNHPVLYGT